MFKLSALLFLIPGVAAAADTEANAVSQIAGMAIEILAAVLLIVALWGTRKIISLIEKKTSIDVPSKIEEKVDQWVAQGINLAAEKSRKKVSEHSEKLTGPEKLETAAEFVLALVEARGWDEWTKEKITDKIESVLGAER